MALYQDPQLRRTLPDLLFATDNADGKVVSQSGYRFPPFFVLERGLTLQAWVGHDRARKFFEVSRYCSVHCHQHCAHGSRRRS